LSKLFRGWCIESKPDDPRLSDEAYLAELAWVTEQVEASGCVCCHDSKVLGKQAGEWDIRLGPLWLDSLPDTGLALFAGLADSSTLGAYHPEDNNGFNRDITGIPSAGYCTKAGCKTDPSVCRSGWSCFDLSLFSPDLPAICTN
jgi:hypothetical protein